MNDKAAVKPAQDDSLIDDDDLNMMMTMMMMFVMVAIVSSLTAPTTAMTTGSLGFGLVSASTGAQQLQGHVDNRVLSATPTLQWLNLISDPPYTSWVTASFFNDGLLVDGIVVENSVFIGINNPDNLHELLCGESYDVDMTGSRGIELIYYTSPNRCTVRVVGKY